MMSVEKITQKQVMMWNDFYSKNSFGIFIECTKCKKWRKCRDYNEPDEVEETWCCSMNTLDGGVKGSCTDPEEMDDETLFDYSPGSVVWAKLVGYPWWPAIVDADPDTAGYYRFKENGAIQYNVTFLDEDVTHSWISSKSLCPFLEPPYKHKPQPGKYSSAISKAEKRAKIAVKMTVKDRLKKFSFVHQYKGEWPLAEDDPEGDIQDMTGMLWEEVNHSNVIEPFDTDVPDDDRLGRLEKEKDVYKKVSSNIMDSVKSAKREALSTNSLSDDVLNQTSENFALFEKKELTEKRDLNFRREISSIKKTKHKTKAFKRCKKSKVSEKPSTNEIKDDDMKGKNFWGNAEASSNISPVRSGYSDSSKNPNNCDKDIISVLRYLNVNKGEKKHRKGR